jgi:hypothetical protein
MRSSRVVLILWVIVWIPPAYGGAQWIVTPFAGLKIGGDTNFVDLDQGAGAIKLTLGGAVGLLGDGVLGVEGDFGYSPRFFESDSGARLVVRSGVTTLMGNVIVATPRELTRESLRPYFTGGVGLMRATIDDVAGVFRVNSNLLGLSLGGGAIGAITERASLRFDVRHFKNISKDDASVGFGTTRLGFWRLTAGVTLRYGGRVKRTAGNPDRTGVRPDS